MPPEVKGLCTPMGMLRLDGSKAGTAGGAMSAGEGGEADSSSGSAASQGSKWYGTGASGPSAMSNSPAIG